MNIGSFSLKNKYFVLSFAIAIILFGVYAKATLKTQLSPDTTPPMATVVVQYPGASAQDVVKDVTEPIEDELRTIEGISNIKSTSQDNVTSINLNFNYGVNVDQAAIDIQNSINSIRGTLPSNISEPKVLKFSTSDKPIATISLSSDSIKLSEIRQLVKDKIGFDFQTIEGVASIDTFGGNTNQIQIKLDKNKMSAYNLSLELIDSILYQNNIKAPGGNVVDNNKEILVRLEEGFEGIEDIKNLRIPLSDGNMIYLRDIAEVELSIEKLQSTYKYNGEESIAVMVTKKSDANTVEVMDTIKNELETLKIEYPYIDFQLAQDDSVFTAQMIDNMTSSVLIALFLTVIIIMLFVGNISHSLVISLSMPLVFMTTLGLMKLFDMKLDMVTLSALILSIGFVVDGAIVVVENITTHYVELKKDIVTATIDATKEITMPIISGATTTLIVLIPLLFIKGFVGEMFRPLAMTIIFAISSSIVIALIIIPLFTVMLTKFKFTKTEKITQKISNKFNKMMNIILDFYINVLKISLKRKAAMYLSIVVLLIASISFLMLNGIEMLPKFDSGTTYISIELEPGTKLEDTMQAVDKIEKLLNDEKNIVGYDTQVGYEKNSKVFSDFGMMGTNQAVITINLTPRTQRKETIWQFQKGLRTEIDKIPDIKRFVVKEKGGTATTSASAPIDVKISGPDQMVLYDMGKEIEEKIKSVEGTTNIYKSFDIDSPQIVVKTNSQRMQELGLTNAVVAKQLYNTMEGIKSSNIDINDTNNIDISVKYMDEYTTTVEDLLDVYISSPKGIKVPFREIATLESSYRANVITKDNLEYTIDILGYTQDRPFNHISKDIEDILKSYPLPNEYSIKLAGENEDMSKSIGDMAFLLLLAVIFVYLVLVSQFKSFMHPITIMASIPLVIIGIAPALGLSGKLISMPVLLGFILLAGTVVNNAILLLDQIRRFKEEGNDVEESVILAVKSRYRPIMMTALSDVVGMLPLALQLSLGSERFSPLAIAVIGGILSATFLTMIVIPIIYVSFENIRLKFAS